MITKREKLLWIFYGIALLVLFLLSSTNLIIKEKEPEIYSFSVIVEDTTDEYYVNFRKGVERAAIELNADVSFITLYEADNQEQQTELMLREQQDGSRGLIVSPVEQETVVRLLSEKRIVIPLVFINSEASLVGEGVSTRIAFDYHTMGKQLAEQVLTEQGRGATVYLLGQKSPDMVSRQFMDGICSVLDTGLCRLIACQGAQEGEVADTVKKLSEGRREGVVIIALDPGILTEAAQFLSDHDEDRASVALYGRGTTVRILNYLDKEIIEGLCITDDFSAGYLSVKKAVELSDSKFTAQAEFLKSDYIKKEDLRDENYEKLLYPIE